MKPKRRAPMPKTKKARAVGFNHIALEVGDIEEALAFYGRLFEFKLRGKSEDSAFIDLGDQLARLDTKLTIEDLAGALGLSAGFFSRAFKAAVGKAPHAYIVDCRISRARRLLKSTELDLTTIAHA